MIDILDTITKNREARRWTEYQLAERAGLPQTTISTWYRKKMTPSFSSLAKICEAFGISLSQFFAEADDAIILTKEQQEVLEKWAYLTPGQKRALLDLMNEI